MQKKTLSAEPALLSTKLHIPRARPGLVARPHLVDRLNDGATRQLVLISAPAGFGKTTLLTEWIPQSAQCVCWVSLDEGDNDPARFWSYVVGALQMLADRLGQSAQPLLQASRLRGGRTGPRHRPADIEPFLTALLNDLAAFPDRFSMVLDDYHVIENQAIHQALTFLLSHLPRQMHLILTSRSDPPLPLARLRARDQLCELRASDLRFTSTEVAAFLNEVMGLTLAADDIAALAKSTEGWVAGLQLAALSLQGHNDPGQFIAEFVDGDRFILEYLTEEVLRRQPEPIQAFLLKTSILERLTGPLCDAVMGGTGEASPKGVEFLETLDRANLFFTPLVSKRCWYRYHPLFAGLLSAYLVQSLPEEVPALHSRASGWFEQNGLIDEAVSHAFAAGDTTRVARLLEAAARELLFVRFEPLTLLRWLAALPTGFVASRPALGLAEAWARVMTGQRTAANERLDAIASTCAALPDDARAANLGEVAAVRATMAIAEADAASIVAQAQLALACLPDDDVVMRARVSNVLGIGQRYSGNALAAEKAFVDAAELSKLAGDAVTIRMSTGWRADLLAEQGRLREAAEAHRQGEELPGVQPGLGAIYIGAGALLREWNDLDGAMRWVDRGMKLAGQGALHLNVIDGHIALARIAQARRDSGDALGRIDQALECARKHGQPLRNDQLSAWRARFQLMQGDLAAALRWAHDSRLAVGDAVPYSREDIYLTLARVLLAHARQDRRSDVLPGVRQMLERLLQAAQSGGRASRVLEILLLQAMAADAEERPARAHALLTQALALAEPEGYVRSWLDEGSPLAALLERYRDYLRDAGHQAAAPEADYAGQPHEMTASLTAGRLLAYVEKLLVGFQTEMAAEARSNLAQSSEWPAAGVERLTTHELAVLRLLAAGLSAPEIAQKYVVSINTIKTQTKSIYAKLGVHSRAEVLAAAAELRLL